MTNVRIAQLKSRLSEYLRLVRDGKSLTVLDRDRPVARLIPVHAADAQLQIRTPAGDATALRDLALPEPISLDTDPVALLLAERQSPA